MDYITITPDLYLQGGQHKIEELAGYVYRRKNLRGLPHEARKNIQL